MEIKEGYLYHISLDFFELVDDPNLSVNHAGVHSRPTYFLVKDKELLWFIPLSTKIDKYKKIVENKKQKYGRCNTVLIRKIANKENAILIQNAFPTLSKFLSHPHTVNGKPYRVPTGIQREIKYNFDELMKLKKRGMNLFFTDVDKIIEIIKRENDRPRQYFLMADQYLETSKLLLTTMINSGNTNIGLGKSELEAEINMKSNCLKSDSTLFLPALFSCFQSIELFIKGLLILNNIGFQNIHEVSDMIKALKEYYGETNIVYKRFYDFYKYQVEIVKKFTKNNHITTTKELYESLRYPENKRKMYSYFDLKYNYEYGIKMFRKLMVKMDEIKEIVLKEFNMFR